MSDASASTRQRRGLTPAMWAVVKNDDRSSVAVCVEEIEVLREALRYIRAEARENTQQRRRTKAMMLVGLDNIILECEGVLSNA